jgi:hypothetical protein
MQVPVKNAALASTKDKDHQKRDQADQIKVIQVLGLIEKEDVGEGQKKEQHCQPVAEACEDAEREKSQEIKVMVHSVSRPGGHPFKPIISEVEVWLDKVAPDAIHLKVAADFPEHDGSEAQAKNDQPGNVHRGEHQRVQTILKFGVSHGAVGSACGDETVSVSTVKMSFSALGDL